MHILKNAIVLLCSCIWTRVIKKLLLIFVFLFSVELLEPFGYSVTK